MILVFISSLIAPFLTGYFLVMFFWRSNEGRSIFALKLILGLCIGMTISSMIYFLALALLTHFIAYVFVIEWTAVFLLLYILKRKRIKIFSYHFHLIRIKRSSSLNTIFFCILLYGFMMSLFSLIYLAYYQPYGQGDAWAIWNLKARFIYRDAGLFWRNLYSPIIGWSHPDYPLLLPLSIARIWTLMKTDTVRVPMYFSVIISVVTIILLFISVYRGRNLINASVATMVLISTPFFLTQGTSQYADTLLSLYYLVSLVLISIIYKNNDNNWGQLVLLGTIGAASCWIKNEGGLFFLAILLSAIVTRRKIVPFLFGALPVLFIVLLHKSFSSSQDLIISQNIFNSLSQFIDFSRHVTIIKKLAVEIISFGQWRVNPLILLGVCTMFFTDKISKKERTVLKTQFFILIMTAAFYYSVYVVLPFGLSWRLERSANRLLIQLWPSFIYLFFLRVKINYRTSTPRDLSEIWYITMFGFFCAMDCLSKRSKSKLA